MAKEKLIPIPESIESFYQRKIEKLEDDLFKLGERNHDLVMRYVEMSGHIKELKSMTQRSMGINPETQEFDERTLDETLETINDNHAIVDGIMSRVYRGRVVSIKQRGDRSLLFYFGNHNLQMQDKNYEATVTTLSEESFVLILEAMTYAAKRFGTNREQIAKSLTGTDEPIGFKHAISQF